MRSQKNLQFFCLIMFFVLFPLQAAFTRVESELTERRGMTLQTRVRRVFVARALSGVRGSAAHPPTVSTRSRGSAACPVMVSDLKEKGPNYWRWSTDLQITNVLLAGCLFHGKEYSDGTEFGDDEDPCSVCYCYGGEVVCTKMPCYGECSHPYKAPGQCCGECDRT